MPHWVIDTVFLEAAGKATARTMISINVGVSVTYTVDTMTVLSEVVHYILSRLVAISNYISDMNGGHVSCMSGHPQTAVLDLTHTVS